MKNFDYKLFLIALFLGWFGVDKFYKKATKLGIIKLLTTFVVVGIVWNFYDLYCIATNKYKLHPFA